MAESGDRTLAPTPKRRLDAQRRGEVARSPEFVASIVFLGGIVFLSASAAAICGALQTILHHSLTQPTLPSFKPLAIILLPLLGTTAIAILAALAQSRFTLHPRQFQFPPRRALSLKQSSRDIALGTVKLFALAWLAYYVIAWNIRNFFLTDLTARSLARPAIHLAVIFVILGLFDYLIRRIQLERRLRMTRREQLQEIRDSEGDPSIRARRRQIAERFVTQRRANDLRDDDLLIAAPPSLLVALRYDAMKIPTPLVVTVARGTFAQYLHQAAEARRMKIVQRPELARSLSKLQSGAAIPTELYQPVADVIAHT